MTAIAPLSSDEVVCGGYCGARMTAEEYFQIPDDGGRYELIDGVVIVSPSPTPEHQDTAGEIFQQFREYVVRHKLGKVLFETDVQLGIGASGKDEVFRPEIVFYRAERVKQIRKRLVGAPDVVVEVVSPYSRKMDSQTKYEEYERAGVHEYWFIDPQREEMRFYRLKDGRFVEASVSGDSFTGEAVPGFVLDLKRVRDTFRGW